MIKTKFQVISSAVSIGFSGVKVILQPAPIDEQAGENLSLFDGQSKASIELYLTQPSAANFFQVGKRYSVTFEAE